MLTVKQKEKTHALHDSNSSEELIYTAELSLKESGNINTSKLLKETACTTPTRALKIQTVYTTIQNINPAQIYSEDEALALFIDAKLTKSQCILIRLQAKQKNAIIYA